MKRFLIFLLVAIIGVASLQLDQASASFNKNRLIDDQLFTATGSMSVSAIQKFLQNQGSVLANWKDDVDMVKGNGCLVHKATGKTAARIIWEAANDWKAQYIQNCSQVRYYDDNNLKTVSPKVLLVTLQKEQSLITTGGTYPKTKNAYVNPSCCGMAYKLAWAMGYGVPDTGGKDHSKKGFYNQINYAAWQLRFNFERSGGNTSWDTYPGDNVVGTWVYSGPMTKGFRKRCAGCTNTYFDGYYPIDGSPLYMGNRATASLYYYTPHTYPGFFGNYNFVNYYKQWFGPVVAGNYRTAFHSLSDYPTIKQGESTEVSISFKNTGSSTWYDNIGAAENNANAVRLGTSNPFGRNSQFGELWIGKKKTRPTGVFDAVYEADGVTLASDQNRATTGQIAKFTFTLKAPPNLAPGLYREFVQPIIEGPQSMNSLASHFVIRVTPSVYKAQFYKSSSNSLSVSQGRERTIMLQYKNVGNMDWHDVDSFREVGASPVRLATSGPVGRLSKFGDSWGTNNRAAGDFSAVYEADGTTLAEDQDTVEPGQIAEFEFTAATPLNLSAKTYRERFTPIVEGAPGKMNVLGSWFDIRVSEAVYRAAYVSSSAYPTLGQGDDTTVEISYKNTGNIVWFDDVSRIHPTAPYHIRPTRLATSNPLGRSSDFGALWGPKRSRPATVFASVYEADGVTLAAAQHLVLPGQIVTYAFDFKAPSGVNPNTYREHITPLLEGYPNRLPPKGSFFDITVTP